MTEEDIANILVRAIAHGWLVGICKVGSRSEEGVAERVKGLETGLERAFGVFSCPLQ